MVVDGFSDNLFELSVKIFTEYFCQEPVNYYDGVGLQECV